MIHVAREAGAREQERTTRCGGRKLGADTPQLVLAVRRQGSREQAWSLRLLGRAVARRLPDLRVSLACVDRDAPALTEVMASATSRASWCRCGCPAPSGRSARWPRPPR